MWYRLLQKGIAVLGLGGVALALACEPGPTLPPLPLPPAPPVEPPPNANVSGEFRLVAVGGGDGLAVCVASLDPAHGTVQFAYGSLRFDTLAAHVHVRQRLLEGFACSGSLVGTVIDVAVERRITQRGDSVFVERPHPSGGTYTDVAVVTGDTLHLSMSVPPLGGPGGPPLGRVLLRYVR
jgi:hypothetical protein